jgi:hypothetical protein
VLHGTAAGCAGEELPAAFLTICVEQFQVFCGELKRVPNFYYQVSGLVGRWVGWPARKGLLSRGSAVQPIAASRNVLGFVRIPSTNLPRFYS